MKTIINKKNKMEIIDQTKVMDINYTKPNTVYNIDFKWPEMSQKTVKKQVPTCTICTVNEETNKSVATTENEKKINDFRALFNRFPYLKDALCKTNLDEIDKLFEKKNQTTYDSDYKIKHDGHECIIRRVAKDDDDHNGLFKREARIKLKSCQGKNCSVKFSAVSPPEPYVVSISEYRSTIHTTGTRIINEQLMVTKTKKK